MINKSNGSKVTIFKDISKVGVDHFNEIYKIESRVNVVEVVKNIYLFQNFVNEDNVCFMENVSKEAL